MAAQGHSEGQSVNIPPLFDEKDYTYWKTRMENFLQGLDYQIWSIVEEGDLLVTNERDKLIEDDKKKISLNCKAKSILCCSLSKKEFNRISACKSTMEMWEKLRNTYEGTNKVKETRIDILVTQNESFGYFLFFKQSLDREEYADFLEDQRQLHIKRMLPDMGPSYSIASGVFQIYFEEQESKALRIIQWYASLLSPAFNLSVTSQDT
ncbi:hypothetical protein Taro_017032 [Colocasia esculenta]|uniref:DUF4219 domain-containing protein n=1 Tax=Colocasia esculenta TaxID=4460 RepID=A0A843UUT3_COLES|nr:hypothetical protein [Colocasia esculenta]